MNKWRKSELFLKCSAFHKIFERHKDKLSACCELKAVDIFVHMHKNMPNRRPLFLIDGAPVILTNAAAAQNVNDTPARRLLLLGTKCLRLMQIKWKLITSCSAVVLLAVIWYYPLFFLFLLFAVYSIFLVLAGKSMMPLCVWIFMPYYCNGNSKVAISLIEAFCSWTLLKKFPKF